MIACVTCPTCEIKVTCQKICDSVEMILPSMEAGRLDAEDLPRLVAGKTMTNLILDAEPVLTPRQQQIVRLYYREGLLEKEIAVKLQITQQAVSDSLRSVKDGIWKMMRKRMTTSRQASPN